MFPYIYISFNVAIDLIWRDAGLLEFEAHAVFLITQPAQSGLGWLTAKLSQPSPTQCLIF